MKCVRKIGWVAVILSLTVLFAGCGNGDREESKTTAYESQDIQGEKESLVAEDTKGETEKETEKETEDIKQADDGIDRFIEGYEIVEKSLTLSMEDSSLIHYQWKEGILDSPLGEYKGMLYVNGYRREGSVDIDSICRVSAEEGGEVEELFSLEPYQWILECGMIEDKFYYLYSDWADNGLVETKFYEYSMDGSYQILDTWLAPYAPNYWRGDSYIGLNITWEDRCEIWLYDMENGRKELIKTTSCELHSDGSATGETILHGGALNDKGFCYEIACLENEFVIDATRYDVYFYDFATGESQYLYSPQHQPFIMNGDERFIFRTETVEEKPLKDPTTFYDKKTGEWGRIAIPGVNLGKYIKEIKPIGEGEYWLCNNDAIYRLDLNKRRIIYYEIIVEDFPEEYLVDGLAEEYLTDIFMDEGAGEKIYVNCEGENLMFTLSDLQELSE